MLFTFDGVNVFNLTVKHGWLVKQRLVPFFVFTAANCQARIFDESPLLTKLKQNSVLTFWCLFANFCFVLNKCCDLPCRYPMMGWRQHSSDHIRLCFVTLIVNRCCTHLPYDLHTTRYLFLSSCV